MSTLTDLNPRQRHEALAVLEGNDFDVLVIGGGVVGAGVALDAASRGLRVALIEARDYASGTSSRSTKLFHGGLRYLEQFQFSLVWEALHERTLMVETLAPHLTRPIEILYPLRRAVDRPYVGMGVGVYDVMGARKGVPRSHRHIGRTAARALFPSGNPDAVKGGVLFHEAQVDDARHTLALVRTAADSGAIVVNSVRAEHLLRDGDRVVGARVADIESGHAFDIHASATITAVGVWTQELIGSDIDLGFALKASKGVHITVPRERIDCETALISRTERSVLFVIPWGEVWVIGTTDTPWDGSRAHPSATSADIDYLLDEVNSLLSVPVTRADIVGVYVGLRPLIDDGGETNRASREHAVAAPVPGLVAVAGGKYTTYRVMAQEAVDACVPSLSSEPTPSSTESLPLVGSRGYASLPLWRDVLKERIGVDDAALDRLIRRYGTEVHTLADYIEVNPSLAEPVAAGYLKAEIHHSVIAEGALHLDDVLARRTRLSIETPDRGVLCARPVAEIMAGALGWTAARVDAEVDAWVRRVEAEVASQQQATDVESDRVRNADPDSRNLAS